LKPGGFRSHGFGIVGSTMMIMLLTSSIRKRTSLLGNMGFMKNWLNFHIFLGIIGPMLIILHSTLKLNGLVSVSFWSMIAVASSGVLGRYLYLQIPRTILGNELTLDEVENLNQSLASEIIEKLSLDINSFEQLEEEFIGQVSSKKDILAFIVTFLTGDLFLKLLNKKAALNRRIQFWNRIHQVFHYWHVFHKPFAIIMYLIMIVHIAISIWLGYTWIF